MRIAMFASNYPPHPGGLEVAVRALATELSKEHQVIVVTTAWRGNAGTSREASVEVMRLPAIHASERAGVPYPVPAGPGVRRALRAIAGADVVHAHGALYATTLLAARAARRLHCPLVLTEHVGFVPYSSAFINSLQRLAWKRVGDATVRQARFVVTYNARVGDWLRARHPGAQVRHVENGVDTSTFRPPSAEERNRARVESGLPRDQPLALFVGRHSEKKNLDAVLALDRRDFTLVVCGATRGLAGERIVDLGVIPHERMPVLYASVDFMIHVSTGEGFPLAVQEAFACGVPVVLLWDEGYRESVDRAVPITIERIDQLAATVDSVTRDPELRSAVAARARGWALRHWQWSATATQYEELYQAAADDTANRARSSDDRAGLSAAS